MPSDKRKAMPLTVRMPPREARAQLILQYVPTWTVFFTMVLLQLRIAYAVEYVQEGGYPP